MEKIFLVKILKINNYNWIEILDFFNKSVGSLKQKRQKRNAQPGHQRTVWLDDASVMTLSLFPLKKIANSGT